AYGRALSSEFAGGADRTTILYGATAADGNFVTNALNETRVYRFAIHQGVPKISEIQRGGVKAFAYDANGYLAREIHWSGNVTEYVNDARGQHTSITEGVGTPQERTTTITYHPTLHLPVQIVTAGLTTNFAYDASGNVLTRTEIDTTTTSLPYATAGTT